MDNITPIPKRASRQTPPRGHAQRPPEPILLPVNRPTFDEHIRDLVAKLVARAIHGAAVRMSDADIIEMGEAQFEAFIRSVLEDE